LLTEEVPCHRRGSAKGRRNSYGKPSERRAMQMNYGAAKAQGDILYFLHSDTFPPPDFYENILQAVKSGINSGCYQLSFDCEHWFLKLMGWFTRFDIDLIRFGDQSLFVSKEVFELAGGFNETFMVMEDNEIIPRIKKFSRFRVLKKAVTTSARKYLENGIFRLQAIFSLIYLQ
jgi:predicted glycosyltransferase involved in capsule biosynthesis